MKRKLIFINAALILAASTAWLFSDGGGDLVPSQGNGALDGANNPQPSMKSLDIVEPRMPISSLPFVIDTVRGGGSYYLTKSLTSAGGGISVNVDNVSIDLNGFSITGTGLSNPAGVHILGNTTTPRRNVSVKNGTIVGFQKNVFLDHATGCRIKDLDCRDATDVGIELAGNAGVCNDNWIVDCSVSGGSNTGIFLNGNAGQCNRNRLLGCSISETLTGISLVSTPNGQSNGNSITDCSISAASTGARFVAGNGGVCSGNVLLRNQITHASGGGGTALLLDSAIQNRIEANHISGSSVASTFGVRSSNASSANFILRNTVAGFAENYEFNANDTFGREVSTIGVLGTSGAGASPWANFSR